jgi:hypothetical protein
MANRQTFGGWRAAIGFTFVAFMAVLGAAWFAINRQSRQIPEIAVLTAASNTTTWTRTVGAAEWAAQKLGLRTNADGDAVEIRRADGSPLVVFKRYRDVGLLEIAHRVASLSERRHPPIAVLGGSNSTAARVIAEALQDEARKRRNPPLFLLTSGTVDDLVEVYPNRTFRFGHPNSRQVREVVEELKLKYEDQGVDPPIFKAALVSFDDDPLSADVARRMRAELVRVYGETRMEFQEVALPTATGSHDDPSPREKDVCRLLAQRMVEMPAQPWIVVLPTGADALRRLSIAMHEALRIHGDEVARLAYDNLTVVAADSLDFPDFTARLSVDDIRVQAIFFAQFDPRAAGEEVPNPDRLALSLYADAVHTALAAARTASVSLDSESFRQALIAYKETDAETYFDGPERRSGGGAVRVAPNPMTRRFDFELAGDRAKPVGP